MNIFRKAYSVAGAVLMLQFALQLYFIAAAALGIFNANDNAKDVYSAFKNVDVFASLHRLNGDLAALTILIMVGLGGFLTGRNWAFGRRAESATPTH